MIIEIIIPSYNCTKTLVRTLGSLVAQTDNNFKVHIIDDCSTEDLMPIINNFKNLLDIRVTRNIKNLGCGMTRQVGIDLTEADYIAFLDSDDVLMPYTVETWRCMAIANPEIELFHSYFYEQTYYEGNPCLTLIKNGYTWMHGKLYKVSFIRKWDIKNDPRIKYADDSFYNSMCTELTDIGVIPISMYCWLNNQESITRCGNLKTNISIADFKLAMEISINFLKSKGIRKIKHIPQSIQLFESIKSQTKNETIIQEIDDLIKFLNDVNQEV